VIRCLSPSLDNDIDGCTNQRELAASQQTGGRRNPDHFWDIYDVWTHIGNDQSLWTKNGAVDLFGDIFGVAFRYGASGSVPSTEEARIAAALTPPSNVTGYHIGFDRSAPPPGGDVWDMGPPNGTIDLFNDIFGVATQFGHYCT
jgi:hypothetical protein